MNDSRLPRAALALAVLACLSGPARAQYAVPMYNPYNPYYNPGGVLSGAADLTNARGNFQIQTQQARVISQQANQANLDFQRQNFDLMNYEKANTPIYAEQVERMMSATVRRMLSQSPLPEITSGTSLNSLTTFIRRMTDQGVVGPPIPLDPAAVKMLNLAPPGGTVVGPGLGMVSDWDNAPWPLALYDAKKDIDPYIRAVIYQARERTLNPKTYDDARKKVKYYQDNLYKLLAPGKVDTGAYFEASTFLSGLESSIITLRQPNAYKYFANDYVAKGNNVLELTMYVSSNGLTFSQARPEHETAYVSVYRGMVSYIRGAEGTTNFMTRIGDPSQLGKYGGKN